jgi:hypothetical protein
VSGTITLLGKALVFDLQFISRRKKLAQIRIGSFVEDFGVSIDSSTTSLESEWRREASRLLGRKKKVALPACRHGRVLSRAWILYRVGDVVFVQDRVFLRGFDAKSGRIPARETSTDDGRRISEWSVSLAEVVAFARKMPNPAPEPGIVTPPAESGAVPIPPVAHL